MTGASAGFKRNLYRLPLDMSVQATDVRVHLEQLLFIEQACFPSAMQDDHQDFIEFFKEPKSAGLILYKGAQTIGSMIGTKITDENSPGILEKHADIADRQDETFYLDSISIVEEHRAPITFDFLIHETACLMKQRGYEVVTGHARCKRGYSRLLQRRYAATVIHTYENWRGFNERFDYVRIVVNEIPTLPVFIHKPLGTIRTMRRKRLYNRARKNA